jgi:hypothetical protein
MKYPLFTEIVTIGLFLAFYFNWHKIAIRTRLHLRRFIRSHICQRVNPDFDLDFTPIDKVQPTGRKNELYIEIRDKFLMDNTIHGKWLVGDAKAIGTKIIYHSKGHTHE